MVRYRRNALVEDQECLKDLQLVLVGHGTSDLVVQLLVSERLTGMETLVRESGPVEGFKSKGQREQGCRNGKARTSIETPHRLQGSASSQS